MTTEYEIQGHYGHGWELVTTEETLVDAQRALRDYRANEPDYAHRLRVKKVRISSE